VPHALALRRQSWIFTMTYISQGGLLPVDSRSATSDARTHDSEVLFDEDDMPATGEPEEGMFISDGRGPSLCCVAVSHVSNRVL
jgi:hypothetical protein